MTCSKTDLSSFLYIFFIVVCAIHHFIVSLCLLFNIYFLIIELYTPQGAEMVSGMIYELDEQG